MKTSSFNALGRRLLPALPNFVIKGQLLFMNPIGQVLRGIYFDRSVNPRAFYVQVFVQPLYIPANHLGFNVGWRLGGGSHTWDADTRELPPDLEMMLKQKALPFLSCVQSPKDVAAAAASLQKSKDPYVQQVIAYALAHGGETEQAILALTRLIQMFEGREQYPWQEEMAQRADVLKSELQSDPLAAQRRFETWEVETIKKLGLERFR